MPKPRSMQSTAHGLTLIEVVAALAILSTLLVSILIAFHQNANQLRAAQHRLTAIAAAEQLLSEWYSAGTTPRTGEDNVPGTEGLRWRAVPSTAQLPESLDASLLRIELFRPQTNAPEQVLATVELLVEGRQEHDQQLTTNN